jgi:hypothetical protein
MFCQTELNEAEPGWDVIFRQPVNRHAAVRPFSVLLESGFAQHQHPRSGRFDETFALPIVGHRQYETSELSEDLYDAWSDVSTVGGF